MRTFKIRPHAIAVRIGCAQRRVRQEFPQPFRIDARAFGQKLRRQLFLNILILRQAHQDGVLAGHKLVASHAVVLPDHPPAFLNIFPRIAGLVLITGGEGSLFTAQQEGRQRPDLLLGQVHIRHAEFFFFRLIVLALVVKFPARPSCVRRTLCGRTMCPWMAHPADDLSLLCW